MHSMMDGSGKAGRAVPCPPSNVQFSLVPAGRTVLHCCPETKTIMLVEANTSCWKPAGCGATFSQRSLGKSVYHCKKKSRNYNKIFAARERKEHRDKNLWSFPLCQGNVCQGNGRGPRLDYSPDNHSPDFSPALPILHWSSPCSFWFRPAALCLLGFFAAISKAGRNSSGRNSPLDASNRIQ
jgi:hypothetical protein